MRALLLCLLLVLAAGLVSRPCHTDATVWYTATTGSDAHAGTQAQPFQTIRKGLSVLRAGDTLFLRGGTYAENIDSNQQTIPTGTSWNNAVTIAAAPGEIVTLRPNGGNVLGLVHSYIHYVIFDSLILDAVSSGGTTEGVVILGGANHIRLTSGEVKNAPGQGIATITPADTTVFNEFLALKVHDNGSARGRLGHGFYLESADNVIDGCEVYNNAGYGMQIYNGYHGPTDRTDNTIVRNNRIHDNRGDGGVTISHGNNILVYNNLVYNHVHGVAVAYGSPTNTQLYNNTIVSNAPGAGIQISSESLSTVVQNNIVYDNGAPIVDRGISTVQSNNVTTDPTFVDSAADDFHLQARSAARGAGLTVAAAPADKDGVLRPPGASDSGAYQLSRPVTVPAPAHLRATPLVP